MKPAPFEYHRPDSVAEAAELLSTLGEDAKVIAGGQSLVPLLALRLAAFEHLVDIGRIEELRGIERRNGHLWIGAGTTEASLESDAQVLGSAPLLARASSLIGHPQIRNRGTVGGSVAHADPAAEYPAVALALDAEVELASTGGRRTVPAAGLFTGFWSTALEPDELLVGLRFPVWSGRCGFAVRELARRHGDFAIAGAAVAVELDVADRVARCAIALFGMGSTALRAPAAESAATGQGAGDVSAEEIGHLAVADLDEVPADLHGSSAYRTRVGAVMVSRAWTAAIEEAGGE